MFLDRRRVSNGRRNAASNEADKIMDSAERQLDFGLIANFVHQVINPLNAVSGTLSNLIDGTIQGSRREQRLRAARAQLETTILLVRNLAYFSGISLDPTNVNPGHILQPCVVPKIILEAAQFFAEIGENKGITIRLTDRRTQFTVKGNPDLLRQVFMNLFDNGIKYGLKNSTLSIEPWVQRNTEVLLIRISGQSVGVSPGESAKLFDLGYRGDRARDQVSSGTGLGLYICRTIMESVFKGSIELEVGTSDKVSFLLRFPGPFL